MVTSENVEDTTLNQLTLFAEDSLAKMLVLQGNGRGLRESAPRSGQSSTVLFAKFVPGGSLLKTSLDYTQVMMGGSSQRFSENWPRAGMMQNGRCYQRRLLVRSTYGKGCSLWPTPRASMGMSFPLASVQKSLTRSFGANNLEDHLTISLCQENQNLDGLYMNPEWVEWIQGFPTGWTDLEHSETPSCPK